ncbi:MAG: Asp23/Gls24 family envelope stress response protein [Clostridia bacterium]|nr:Asp23/Gls24 family envelope stress response protein [Clostridia bacterium]
MDDIFEISDNEIRTENTSGNIKISNDVVAAIAGISAEEVKGVAHMYTSLSGAIAEKLGSKKNQSKGVKVVIGEQGIAVDLIIVAQYGVRLRDVSEAVQRNVRENVETMTGMNVTEVNVRVEGVSFDNQKTSDDVKIIDEA